MVRTYILNPSLEQSPPRLSLSLSLYEMPGRQKPYIRLGILTPNLWLIGDGRADFMWVDKVRDLPTRQLQYVSVLTGMDLCSLTETRKFGITWAERAKETEMHCTAASSSSMTKARSTWASRGSNMHYPNLGGLGRADQVQVDPTSGHVSCGHEARSPHLPLYLASMS